MLSKLVSEVKENNVMKIRGYVSITNSGVASFSNMPMNMDGWKEYTFEIEVPHPLPELKVIPESVEEVKP